MTAFETLFGIKESQVKKTSVLMPLLRKNTLKRLGIKGFSRGRLYGSGNNSLFTVIHTGVGPGLLGDAVLYLGKTQCQNVILFGSCGLLGEKKGLKIGGLVTPSICYSLESFTEMLLRDKKDWKVFYPDKTLLENFLNTGKSHSSRDIKKVICLSVGSLKLEKDYLEIFKKRGIQTVDMECASLFSASEYIKRKAMAFFYITDIINKKPFYADLNAEDKTVLSSSIESSVHILCEFIKNNLSC